MITRTLGALISILLMGIGAHRAQAQVENVPVNNQVYEFLDRMGVRGILPLYSNATMPLSRQAVAELLRAVEHEKNRLTESDQQYLGKFTTEFIHELNRSEEAPAGFFNGSPLSDIFSQKEKFLYWYADSNASAYVELIGTLEHRRTDGGTHASFEQHGGRIRGTVVNRLGYFLQGTNGTLYGDKAFALSDPRLRGNVKFKDLNSPYFDFTEAYVRGDLTWFHLQFGREYNRVGTGYSDPLLLSDNSPVFDFLKLDVEYRSLKFVFLHGSLVGDSAFFPGTLVTEPSGSTKYLALHRVQFSLFSRLNLGLSEMIIYQRFSPEFAYLNPVNFYKSAEHSLHDRDNAFLNLDAEVFPADNWKLYGTWLIDDIDFSKMGTGWWGNEFGWQGGVAVADVAGIPDLGGVVEYTRLEPYVYSNRTSGNDYTNDNIGLGHHLDPNSDEWFIRLNYRPSREVRAWLTYTRRRHGENVLGAGGEVLRNVGGSALQGHRDEDSETAAFLDGNLVKTDAVGVRIAYEPFTDIGLQGTYEYRREHRETEGTTSTQHYFALQFRIGL